MIGVCLMVGLLELLWLLDWVFDWLFSSSEHSKTLVWVLRGSSEELAGHDWLPLAISGLCSSPMIGVCPMVGLLELLWLLDWVSNRLLCSSEHPETLFWLLPAPGLAGHDWLPLAALGRSARGCASPMILVCPMIGLAGAAGEAGEELSCRRPAGGGEIALVALLLAKLLKSCEALSETKLPIVVWLSCDAMLSYSGYWTTSSGSRRYESWALLRPEIFKKGESGDETGLLAEGPAAVVGSAAFRGRACPLDALGGGAGALGSRDLLSQGAAQGGTGERTGDLLLA
mmetsp:Transcript_41875/g.81865  ORF Transcript_41875/g.81865 Transcript_41875/m.81865 type:complete len:286 (+) Transcript_41875:228-1085(+)